MERWRAPKRCDERGLGGISRGRITITAGGRTSTLGPGDAYQFPSTLPHRFVNEGDEPCELVSAATPPTF